VASNHFPCSFTLKRYIGVPKKALAPLYITSSVHQCYFILFNKFRRSAPT